MSQLEPYQDQQAGQSTARAGSVSPSLPAIPAPSDLSIDLSSIIGVSGETSELDPEIVKVQKRASKVMKLAEENERLKAELKIMTDKLEAAERKRAELALLEEAQKSGV